MTDTTDNVVRIDIPPDHHPAVLKGETPGSVLGRDALQALYNAAGAINDTAAEVRDKGRLAAAAQPFAERALASAGRALETLQAQVAHLEREIATALRPAVEPTLAGQIRAHHASLGSGKAFEAVHLAISEGDTVTMSAVINAPPYLSGLDARALGVLRVAAAERLEPEKVLALHEAQAAHSKLDRAANWFAGETARNIRDWRDQDQQIIAGRLA